MHHFSTYSNPGNAVVYSTVMAHKFIIISKLLAKPKFLDDKKKLYNMMSKVTALHNREPDSTGTKDLIRRRNELINKYDKGEEIEKSLAEREQETLEQMQLTKRKERAQEYEKCEKQKRKKNVLRMERERAAFNKKQRI